MLITTELLLLLDCHSGESWEMHVYVYMRVCIQGLHMCTQIYHILHLSSLIKAMCLCPCLQFQSSFHVCNSLLRQWKNLAFFIFNIFTLDTVIEYSESTFRMLTSILKFKLFRSAVSGQLLFSSGPCQLVIQTKQMKSCSALPRGMFKKRAARLLQQLTFCWCWSTKLKNRELPEERRQINF